MYTDELIAELITCKKVIVEAPKTNPDSRGSTKRGFLLSSQDGTHEFSAFISQNNTFAENFSLGLVYKLKDEKGTVCLLRVNGLHGGTIEIPHHSYCHVHTTLAEDINNNIKAERHIEECKEYTTIEQAIQYFLKRVNVSSTDSKKHFPPPQQTLFSDF